MNISYPLVSPDTTAISTPFFQDSSSKTAKFTVKASVYSLPMQSGDLWIRPDDCVDKIYINKTPVDDSIIKNQPHCADNSVSTVVHVNISKYLHPGQNDMEIQFIDLGGQYGLDMGIVRPVSVTMLMLASLGLALVFFHILISKVTFPEWF